MMGRLDEVMLWKTVPTEQILSSEGKESGFAARFIFLNKVQRSGVFLNKVQRSGVVLQLTISLVINSLESDDAHMILRTLRR